MKKFRLLRADEIDCRVAQCKENGLSLLLYKDARCDMNILDETVGEMNWQRKHSRENANCEVGIYNFELSQWIWKEDTGTESNTEAEKGLASDSFKRACVNWGIGRELYTAPFIWIDSKDCKLIPFGNGKFKCNDKFYVSVIGYNEKEEINSLTIMRKGDKFNGYADTEVYTLGKKKNATQRKTEANNSKVEYITQMQAKDVRNKLLEMNATEEKFCVKYDLYEVEQMSKEQYIDFCTGYKKWKEDKTA